MKLRVSLFDVRVRSRIAVPRKPFLKFFRFASSKQWQNRQHNDTYRKEAILKGLKSRAAFKLLQIHQHYSIFRPGQTVVDLGYAPGSWSQVAVDLTRPNGRVLGIDIIPTQPPTGVSTIQGNFLSSRVQAYVRDFLRNPERGRPRGEPLQRTSAKEGATAKYGIKDFTTAYIDRGRDGKGIVKPEECLYPRPRTVDGDESVDVVLSDMSAPWQPTFDIWKRSLNDPYLRMVNTSGLTFRDHAGSMVLCQAALKFSFDTLKPGGHFICKFYQGHEDLEFERRLKLLFRRVHREKPDSSRKVGRFFAQ